MKKIGHKLKSSSGVTVVMALLFLLAAIMVATVVISAAMTATRNIKYDRQMQQAYLSVSSAADYVSKQLTGEVQRTVNEVAAEYNGDLKSKSAFWPFLETCLEMASKESNTKTVTFTLEIPGEVQNLQPVDCTLSFTSERREYGDGTMEIQAVFSLHRDEGVELNSDYVLKLKVSGYYIKSLVNADLLNEEDATEADYITTFSLEEGRISKG